MNEWNDKEPRNPADGRYRLGEAPPAMASLMRDWTRLFQVVVSEQRAKSKIPRVRSSGKSRAYSWGDYINKHYEDSASIEIVGMEVASASEDIRELAMRAGSLPDVLAGGSMCPVFYQERLEPTISWIQAGWRLLAVVDARGVIVPLPNNGQLPPDEG